MPGHIGEKYVDVRANDDRINTFGGDREVVAAVPDEIDGRQAIPFGRHERLAVDLNGCPIDAAARRLRRIPGVAQGARDLHLA